jgi:hypothetical protein
MMNGGSLYGLQKILGHSDMRMTERYSHFTPDHLQSSLKFMNMGIGEEQNSFNHNLTTELSLAR